MKNIIIAILMAVSVFSCQFLIHDNSYLRNIDKMQIPDGGVSVHSQLLKEDNSTVIVDVALSPDGSILATAGLDRIVNI